MPPPLTRLPPPLPPSPQLTRLCSDCPLPVDQLAAAVTALTALAALHVAVTWPARQPPAQPQAQPQGVRWHVLPPQVQQPPPPPSASTMARERRSRQQRRRPGGSQGTAAVGATPPGGGAGGAVGAGGGGAGMAADAGAECDDDVDSEDDDGLGVGPEDRDRHLELERWRGRRQPGAARSSGGGIGSSNSSSSGSSSGSEPDGDVVSALLRAAAMHRAWAPPAAGRSPSYALADEHMAVFMAALAALQRLEDLRLAVSCDGMGRTLLPPPGLLAAARRSCPRLRRFVMRVLSEWQVGRGWQRVDKCVRGQDRCGCSRPVPSCCGRGNAKQSEAERSKGRAPAAQRCIMLAGV